MNPSLLPPNATPLERALAELSQRVDDLPVPIARIANPDICPYVLLPWLAWALSVDQWQSHWPESVKRQVLRESIAKHRQKGTVAAVKRALADVGVKAELREWWQQTPKGVPHTFSLTAWVNDNQLSRDNDAYLNGELVDAIHRSVQATKPVRSQYQLTLGARFLQQLSMATVFSVKQSHQGRFTLTSRTVKQANPLASGCIVKAYQRVTRVLQSPLPTLSYALGVGMLCCVSVTQRQSN